MQNSLLLLSEYLVNGTGGEWIEKKWENVTEGRGFKITFCK